MNNAYTYFGGYNIHLQILQLLKRSKKRHDVQVKHDHIKTVYTNRAKKIKYKLVHRSNRASSF